MLRQHALPLLQGSLAIVVCYALFYISTVFALGYGVGTRHIPRSQFLGFLCVAVVFMALATPLSAWLADRFGRRPVLMASSALAAVSGFAMPEMLGQGGMSEVLVFLCLELGLMGLTFAPLGALAAGALPDTGALHGSVLGLQPRRHSRSLAGTFPGAAASGTGWPRLGRLLRHGGGRHQLSGSLEHAGAVAGLMPLS